MVSYAELRAQQSANNIDELRAKFEKMNKPGAKDPTLEDETYWNMNHIRGSDGKGMAVIRLLPAPPNENDPIVKYFEYNFKGPSGWYINRGRNSLGPTEADPAYEYNGKIFQDKSLSKEERKKRLLGRRENYVCGIKVIKDPNKPENEGKIFRFKFGPQIYNIINSKLFPEFETETPLDVFDPINGANLAIKVITKKIPDSITGELKEVPSYERSEFEQPSQLCDIEDFDKIWKQQYSLKSEVAPDKFKSYEQLKSEFDRAMGNKTENNNQQSVDDMFDRFEQQNKSLKEETPKSMGEQIDDEIPPFDTDDDSSSKESDDIDDWFNSLQK